MEKLTPLLRAVSDYVEQDTARFHMPGHKGAPRLPLGEPDPLRDVYPYDITEVAGADSLYEADGAIARTEEAFARLYGSARTLLSAGGSTLCIQTMLALVSVEGGAASPPRRRVVAGRSLHTSAVNAMALLGLEPVWVYPEGSAGRGMAGRVTPEAVEEALTQTPDACAVYITSPDFFGVLSDLAGIAGVCRVHGVPLLVDNAHGAHLRFMRPDRHPIGLGASMCCDSLHKTLPVLTGGALLHVAEERYAADAKRRMALFGSTSPSYLIMLSCDRCLAQLEESYGERLEQALQRATALEELAEQKGFIRLLGERDRTKIVLSVYNWGMSGEAFGERLRLWGIEPEYVGDAWAVLMASPDNRGGDFRRVEKFLLGWDRTGGNTAEFAPPPRPPRVTGLREAALSPARVLPAEEAVGRTAAAMVCPCPPGIPVVMPGEEITPEAAALLKTCGIRLVSVL